jgi:hypothetical protein
MGMATFHLLAGFRFVLIIADDFSASSCPINRTGKSVPGPQCTVRASSCDSAFSVPVPFRTYGHFLNFSEPVTAFSLLLPTLSVQLPFPINRDGPAAFSVLTGIRFGTIIADSLSAFPFRRLADW